MIFDEKYKLYLDWTAQTKWDWDNDTDTTWVEIFGSFLPLSKPLAEGEKFGRYKWNGVTIRNRPKRYADTSNDAFKLYNIIEGLDPDQEIRIKIVTDDNTIRGYFGNNDCKFNDNKNGKIINVTPAILDQYTSVLENIDEKIDVIGIRKNTNARFELNRSAPPITDSHNLPIIIAASDIDEAQNPELTSSPNSGGAFLVNLKSEYNCNFKLYFSADLHVISSGETMKLYLREYDMYNIIVNEYLLDTFTNIGSTVSTSYDIDVTFLQHAYVSLELDMSNSTDTISYTNIDLNVALENIPFDTITVQVDLISDNLIAKNVWTEALHGRVDPKESEWSPTNGVDDYFEESGAPKTSTFSNSDFGPYTRFKTFSNNLDINNEPVEGMDLTVLETSLADFEYELSSVTVWEGKTYRKWAFGKKYRRVFGTCTFSREEFWKIDEGAPDPPPGTGWEQTTVIQGGKRLWIRTPFNDPNIGWDLQAKDSTGGNNGSFEWVSKKQTVKDYITSGNSREFDSVRDLKDIIKTIYNGMHPTLAGKDVISTFFWNDNEGDMDILDDWPSGTNYITFQPNELNRLGCIHTADFDTNDSELNKDNQTLEISFSDMMDDLRKLWDIYWFVDLSGDLHIEHKRYLDLTSTSIDVRGNKFLKETLKWDYNKEIMFATIEYSTVNSGYRDFTNNLIEFNKIASNKRNRDLRLELKTEILSTDIKYCIENPGDLQNGLTIVAYDASFNMISEFVPILQKVFENGAIALSNLLLKYWTYEGVWSLGKINNVDAEFTVTYRTKTGKEINLQNVFDVDGSGDEIKFITTNIGIGMIKNMTLDFNKGITTKITLVYRYDSSPETDVFELIAATDVLYDFGNY